LTEKSLIPQQTSAQLHTRAGVVAPCVPCLRTGGFIGISNTAKQIILKITLVNTCVNRMVFELKNGFMEQRCF